MSLGSKGSLDCIHDSGEIRAKQMHLSHPRTLSGIQYSGKPRPTLGGGRIGEGGSAPPARGFGTGVGISSNAQASNVHPHPQGERHTQPVLQAAASPSFPLRASSTLEHNDFHVRDDGCNHSGAFAARSRGADDASSENPYPEVGARGGERESERGSERGRVKPSGRAGGALWEL